MASKPRPYDLLVIGGGINGVGIARDAAGRGLSVLLVEQGDLASATSSASSKLIHGGLRYLEHYELRLVREALAEREVLLRIAPHIIHPLRFVLPYDRSLRPAWMLRAGLLLYDALAPGSTWRLGASRRVDFRRLAAAPLAAPLRPEVATGFTYSDAAADDSRLVVLNAIDAAERRAEIRTRCQFLSARPHRAVWRAILEEGGWRREVEARAIVNAAGPWVDEALSRLGHARAARVRLVKGSHIVVPRLYEGAHAYILQNGDGRVVFVIPFEGRSLIGTTDIAFSGEPTSAAISREEVDYLCAAVGRTFATPPRPADVLWSYAGVRPLYDDAEADPSKITRDYVLELEAGSDEPPLLSVFGGKLTTYRRLAEEAMAKLAPHLGVTRGRWTAGAPLPGGDLGPRGLDGLIADLSARRPWLPPALATRLARAYGTRVEQVLGNAGSLAALGRDLGAGLSEREVEHLVAHEWARTAEDILWRRSKLGLAGGRTLREALEAWLAKAARRSDPTDVSVWGR
jgi:glycerol-3-phosphate dehydrogenase